MTQGLEMAMLAETTSGNAATGRWSDSLGMVASTACAIHCAAMPFVVASLPALGLSFLADEAFHKWMAVICFGIAMAAFVPGWRRHRRWLPGGIAAAGLTLICSAAFGLAGDCCASCTAANEVVANGATVCTDECCEHCAAEAATSTALEEKPQQIASFVPTEWLAPVAPWLTPLGGLILVAAHLVNRRFGCLCGCCPPAPDAGGDC